MYLRSFSLLLSILLLPLFTFADKSPIVSETPIHEAYATRFTDLTTPKILTQKPPADKINNIPPKPYNEAVWVSGYWTWVSEIQDYKWICGVWRVPPPDHVWIDGTWVKGKEGWIRLNGFWSQFPENQLTIIKETPPRAITENPPAPSDNDSFWASGYWTYSKDKKSFEWLEGAWHPFNPNWVLAPSNYIWRPDGYIFIDPYWDYPIDKRGKAFTCTYPINPISVETVILSCLGHYPDHLNWYEHWWHYNKAWWEGCNCTPPWWSWTSWWSFNWQDQWLLWWWYTHPGFPQPSWITPEISAEILTPNAKIIDFMKKINGPTFIQGVQSRSDTLRPAAKSIPKNLVRPAVKSNVKPSGKITVPPEVFTRGITAPEPLQELNLPPSIERTPSDEQSLTPSLDSDRPNYSQYQPLYEYRYQPEYRYRPEYYYKPYRDDTYQPPSPSQEIKRNAQQRK